MSPERDRLIALVRRLISGDYQSEAEADNDVAAFEAAVPHPNASGLIYYWDEEFDHEPSAEEVVERAVAYRPTEL
ncbi:bacteriocin immunity protein [Tenggerimyces flavus]|uniref:Bacteriocin immunity protein n=1 Tax=Tenggerimyces flavus TaxID=1708749 RepID=A0ABV7YAW6_9ACTN|nr:bacteriocin immunity protein [Tenggerimyces flavus]MBM7789142.1 hypothetical protein [Tenggerimyces flavus]